MKHIRNSSRRRLIGAAAVLPLLGIGPARSQSYPSKPIRLMHAGPAGGPLGQMTRTVGEHLQTTLGQSMIIEPRPNALVGINDLITAPADGYTLMMATDSVVVESPHVLRVSYDPLKSIQALADSCSSPLVIVSHGDSPYRTLREFVDWVKTQPAGSVSFGSFGVGSVAHVLGSQLAKDAGIQLGHVAYAGVPRALVDVMGGHIPMVFAGEAGLPDLIATKKLRALALTGPKRGVLLPDVPTVREAGFPNVESVVTMNLFARPGIDPVIQERLRMALSAAFSHAETVRRLASIGMTPMPMRSMAAIAAAHKAEYERNGQVLRALGVTAS